MLIIAAGICVGSFMNDMAIKSVKLKATTRRSLYHKICLFQLMSRCSGEAVDCRMFAACFVARFFSRLWALFCGVSHAVFPGLGMMCVSSCLLIHSPSRCLAAVVGMGSSSTWHANARRPYTMTSVTED